MKYYFDYLLNQGLNVIYIESHQKTADIRVFFEEYKNEKIDLVNIISCDDNYLQKQIVNKTNENSIKLTVHNNQSFLNSENDLFLFLKTKKVNFFKRLFIYSKEKSGIF